MADVPWGAIIQGAGQIINSQQRSQGAQGASQLEQDAYLRALQMLQGGQLDPKVTSVGPVSRPTGDVQAQLAQRDALMRLQEAARSGFDTVDRAAVNRTMSDAAMHERGQREAAMARLDPNSGAAMAARLGAQQSGANRANQNALDIAAMSRQKALASLGAYGNLAGRMRDQEYGEQNSIDKFNSEISRFNAGNANAASQAGINNKLRGLEVAGGAGTRAGMAGINAANARGEMAQTGANVGGGLINAFGEKNKNSGSTVTNDSVAPAWDAGVDGEGSEGPWNPDDEDLD